MAQEADPSAGARRENAMQMSIEACKTDDLSFMQRAITVASQPNSRHSVADVLLRGLKRAAARQAVHVLQYVLDRGADVSSLSASDLMSTELSLEPLREVLDVLVAHGWDVNTQGHSGTDLPLLWHVVQYHDLVKWCLDHGARVNLAEPSAAANAEGTQSRTQRPRPTILGAAAASGTVETFELLRARNAPLDRRTLHLAVEKATVLAPKEGSEGSEAYIRRMAMVRHLLDAVKLDVNAVSYQVGSQCTTPLCYPAARNTSQDFRELVFLLLDHEAWLRLELDPQAIAYYMDPMTCAESVNNVQFLQAVKEWEESRGKVKQR